MDSIISYFSSLNPLNLINNFPGAIAQGIIWGIMALGVYITFRLLDVADLSVDGTFATGGAVTVMLRLAGMPIWACLLVAVLAGVIAGTVTGFLHTKLGIPAILAGILTQLGLYSINLSIMDRSANKSFNFGESGLYVTLGNIAQSIIVSGIFAVAIVILLYWYFGTEQGSALRATGSNHSMSSAQGINISTMKVIGLALSNGIVALSGGLFAQYQGNADINMGRGAIVIGLAAVIIGEVLGMAFLGKRLNFVAKLLFVIVGGIVYYIVLAIVLWLKLDSIYLKLLSAIIVAIFLAIPYLKSHSKNSFKKAKKKESAKKKAKREKKLKIEAEKQAKKKARKEEKNRKKAVKKASKKVSPKKKAKEEKKLKKKAERQAKKKAKEEVKNKKRAEREAKKELINKKKAEKKRKSKDKANKKAKSMMLEVNNIEKTFNPGTINEKKALDGVSLHLKPGDFVTIIGGNGAGKSTLMNAITGVWPVDNGSIILDGINVTGMSEYKRAKYIGRVFQDPMMGTAPDMQIIENLALAYRRGKKRILKWGITKKEKELYHEKLKILGLGLENRMTSKVGLLSGGQRQALTLLMASLQRPKLLLLDEHTAALDPTTAAKVLEISEEIIRENNLTAMMITHNMHDAIAHGNRLIMMNEGKIIYDVQGEEKKNLTKADLMAKFAEIAGHQVESDKMLLS